MVTGRTTNWSKNTYFQQAPRNPLEAYMGGKPNRAERRAMERLRKKRKVVDDG